MAESDGLYKLTQYLNQTRRQAEASIDTLNQQILELRKENEAQKQCCKKAEEERDQFKNLADKRLQERARLQERDDWKSLIDSVQKDRSRLQTMCCELEGELEQSRGEVAELEEQLRIAEERSLSPDMSHMSQSANGEEVVGPGDPEEADASSGENKESPKPVLAGLHITEERSGTPSPTVSPVRINGRDMAFNFATPMTVAKQLKVELKKAQSQVRHASPAGCCAVCRVQCVVCSAPAALCSPALLF
jgi:hypothetical protein